MNVQLTSATVNKKKMGFILEVDLETSSGPTEEAYVRIDNYRFNKVTSELNITTTTWLDINKAHEFNREYLEDDLKNAQGLIGSKIIYYKDKDDEGEEINIPNQFKSSVTEEVKVVIPHYEEKEVLKSKPYISFDKNGNEVTKYKDVIETEKFKVNETVEIKKKVNNEALTNMFEYSYNVLRSELEKMFPANKIIKK
jgi:hypothetical protein|tara:strand:+ start:195 stop:785 length:591 start_codon:yes stop_codon:yes gene_type:complete